MKSDRLEYIQQRIIQLRTYLLSTDEILSISIDGAGTTVYDRKGAREELKELEREEANLLNPKGYRKHIDLSDAFGN